MPNRVEQEKHMSLTNLPTGHRFEQRSLDISPEYVVRYRAALGGASDKNDLSVNHVPPMALIAASLSKLIEEIEFGAGTIHAAQEVYFARSVKTGERIYTTAEISSNVVRQSSRITTIKSTLNDNDGNLVASATSTVITPANNLDTESNHDISRI